MKLLQRSLLLLLLLIFPSACALFGQTHPQPPSARQRQQQQRQYFQAQRQSPDQQPAAAHLLKAWQDGQKLPVARRTAMRAARPAAPRDASASTWQEMGPKPLQMPYSQSSNGNNSDYHAVSGTVTALAVDLVSDPSGNTVYVGTMHGGLWKSTNALAAQPTFAPLTDSLPASSIGSIAIDATTQPATIYAGTGDQDEYGDSHLGIGILKSTDGGKTWSIITSADNGAHSFLGLSVDRIVIDPANPQHLVVATQAWFQSPTAPYPETGIYASHDGGATWSLQQQFPDFRGWPSPITDLVYDPVGKIFYAAVLGMGIYSSPDGKTWTATSSPLVSGYPLSETTFDRASLAVRNGTLYVLFCTNRGSTPLSSSGDTGLVETTDQGKTWTAIAVPPPTQKYEPSPLFGMGSGNFNQFIAAPPNSNELILGGLDVWTTAAIDGAATTWTNATATSKVGELQHAIAVVSDSVWFEGSSLGLWSTQDGGQTWSDRNDSLATISTTSVLPSGTTAGGYLLGYNNPEYGTAWTDGTSGWTGAGMIQGDLAEDPAHPARLYASSGGTSFDVSNDGGKTFGGYFWGTVEDPSSRAFEVIPGRPWELAASTCRIWVGPGSSTPAGSGWKAVSPNLTVDNPADGCPPWKQGDPQPPPGIALLASAPSDANTMYAVTTNGRVEGSTNLFTDAPVWTHLTAPAVPADTFPGGINGSPVPLHPFSALAVSPTDPKTVYLGVGGFGTGHLFKSSDGGASWTDISGNLPDAPLNSILLDPESPGDLYVATDAGVFVATDGGVSGESWQQVGAGLPAGPVLQIAFSELGPRVIAAATFGRGLWTIAPLHHAGDFDLRVSPDFAFQVQGKATTLMASIDAVNGYNGTVTLSCSGISSSCTIQPAAIQPGQTATITINSTTPSDGILTLSASDGTLSHTQSVRLQTSSIALSPATLDVIIGDWYSYVGVAGINLPDKATLTCGTLPAGVSCSPTSLTLDPSSPGSAQFALRATSDAAPGSYQTQVNATIGDETLTAPLTVNVRSFTLHIGDPTATVSDPSQSAKFFVYANMAQTAPVSVALSCSGAPGITCTFNPATITKDNGTSTVTVSNLGAMTQPLSFNVVGTVGQEQQSVPLTVQLGSWSIQAEPYGSVAYLDPGTDKTMFWIDYTGSTNLPLPAFTCDTKAPVQCSVQAGGAVEVVNLSGLASLPTDTKSYSFTVSASDGTHTQTVPLSVTFGYVEYQTPSALTQVMKGVDTASYTLTSTPVKNYDLPIQMTCSVPQGVTCALSPATMQPGDTSTIAISGLASQPAGDVVATVMANSGVLHTPIKFTTRVADFALTSPTPQQNLANGADTAQFVIKAAGLTTMRGPIQLGCQNAGPVQCSFSPANIVAGASSELTVSGLSKATPNNDQIAVTVTGTAGVDAHTLDLTLQLPDFSGTPVSSGGSGDGTRQSVNAGQTAQYALTYQSVNGFSGSVAMSCSGAPAQATCSVSPATFTLTPGGTQAVNVAVSTSGASTLPPAAGDRIPPVGLGLLLLAVAGLLLTTVPRPRRLTIAGAVLLGTMLLASCGGGGGGSSSPTPPPAKTPTPSGTTTLTITATAKGVAHTTQLTLTVK